MICPACNTENRLGAIFCRSCGGKLQIEDVSRENFEEKTGVKLKEGVKIGKIIRNAAILVVVLALAGSIFLMTRVPAFDKIETSEEALKKYETATKWIEWAKKNDYNYQLDISEEALNAHISDSIESIKKGPVEFKEITIDLLGGNRVQAWFSGKLKNFDIIFSVAGLVNLKGNKLDFTIESAKIGNLPLPGFLSGKVFADMLTLSGDDQKLLDSANAIIISDDKVTVKIKGAKEYKPRKRRR
jgi:hypothetical protein